MWDIIGIILFCVGAFFIIMMFVADYKMTQSVIDYAKFLGLSDDDDIEAEDECFKVIPQKTEESPQRDARHAMQIWLHSITI